MISRLKSLCFGFEKMIFLFACFIDFCEGCGFGGKVGWFKKWSLFLL